MSEWGNNMSFINELGYEIDSLRFTACDSMTMILPFENDEGEIGFSQTPVLPESGYPCPVQIRVYMGSQSKDLLATPFACYHCDISKYYILRGDSAVFQIHYAVE